MKKHLKLKLAALILIIMGIGTYALFPWNYFMFDSVARADLQKVRLAVIYQPIKGNPKEAFVVDGLGRNKKKLFESDFPLGAAAISSREIAAVFVYVEDTAPELILLDANLKELERYKLSESMPKAVWSYDGSYLAFGNSKNIYILDHQNKKIVPIEINKSYIGEMTWATDKSLLIFKTDDDLLSDVDDEIYTYDPNSKKILKICEGQKLCFNTPEGLNLWGSKENPVVELSKFSPSKRFYFYENYIDSVFFPKYVHEGYDIETKRKFQVYASTYWWEELLPFSIKF